MRMNFALCIIMKSSYLFSQVCVTRVSEIVSALLGHTLSYALICSIDSPLLLEKICGYISTVSLLWLWSKMIMHTINVFHFPGIQWFNCPLAGGVLAFGDP